MNQYLSTEIAVSSKGEIVLLQAICEKMQIVSGTKLIAFSDGVSVVLKPIPEPDISEFKKLMDAASAWASKVGMTEEDIASAIKTVRQRRISRTLVTS